MPYQIKQKAYSNRFFNDMSIWSIVVSHLIILAKNGRVIDLDVMAESLSIFCDHNIRVDYQGQLASFEMEEFNVPRSYNYSGKNQFNIKKIFFSSMNPPYVQAKDQRLMKLACAHFQGVESKYILLNDIKFRHLLF